MVFIPEAYGGMDGGAFDSYRICEVMARRDIGLVTAVFATFLGSEPILVGAGLLLRCLQSLGIFSWE
jgi:alkylation response protein AidB-like acyl-CoA dehydrogenase